MSPALTSARLLATGPNRQVAAHSVIMETPVVYLPIKNYVRAELIINCVVVFVVFVVVTLRIIGRVIGPGLGWDDSLVLVATPLGVVMLICQGFFAPAGNGYSLPDNPQLLANVPFILQLTFCMQIVYIALLASVKGSMLCFFLRVFPTPFMKLASKVLLVFVGAWMISYVFACVFLCNPVSAQWNNKGTCGAYIPLIQTLIATNALGDLVIMALPMHSIWSLQTRRADKIGITSCFALGLACVVCAIFRLIYISTVDLKGNVTGTMPTTVFLFTLEPNLAILCVSIPMLRPFYAKYRRRVGGSRLQDYSDERSTGFKEQSQRSVHDSSARRPPHTDDPSTWEMDDYRLNAKVSHDTSIRGLGDESGSEKNLTTNAQPPESNEIRVQTGWTITRQEIC